MLILLTLLAPWPHAMQSDSQPAKPEAAAEESKQAVELGLVNWQTKLEPALAASAKDNKPVLLLFQEIPG